MNYNIERIYDLIYVANFKNIDCTPFNILKRIEKLVEYNFWYYPYWYDMLNNLLKIVNTKKINEYCKFRRFFYL